MKWTVNTLSSAITTQSPARLQFLLQPFWSLMNMAGNFYVDWCASVLGTLGQYPHKSCQRDFVKDFISFGEGSSMYLGQILRRFRISTHLSIKTLCTMLYGCLNTFNCEIDYLSAKLIGGVYHCIFTNQTKLPRSPLFNYADKHPNITSTNYD